MPFQNQEAKTKFLRAVDDEEEEKQFSALSTRRDL